MRLNAKEKLAIQTTVWKFDRSAKIYLFGSRVNVQAKGGDIDLLVISESLGFSEKLKILSEIKNLIGDQKIDVLIKNMEAAKIDPFILEIINHAVEL